MAGTARALETMNSGDRVVIEPADQEDPMSVEWAGRQCFVVVHARSEIYDYVRVRDIGGHKATFRPKDVRRVL